MLVDPNSARSLILHALSQRPYMTVREIADACPKVPFVYLSFFLDDCETCAPHHHWKTATAEIAYYTLHSEAYRLLKSLERQGRVRQIKMTGVQATVWYLAPAQERVAHG